LRLAVDEPGLARHERDSLAHGCNAFEFAFGNGDAEALLECHDELDQFEDPLEDRQVLATERMNQESVSDRLAR
jgi:hypothetical protein